VVTDDRAAILVGLVGWVAGLAIVLVLGGSWGLPTVAAAVWTCAVGIVLGGAGLAYTHRRHLGNKNTTAAQAQRESKN
jgi:hypothetical protein